MTDMTRLEHGYTGPGAGLVFKKFAEVRSEVGVLKAKKKDGVKFKVRSADELADRLRPELEAKGLLVYPVQVVGRGHVVDSGTLAEATVTLRVLCIEDGSYFDIQGFGLGADNQDKAGGKAGTYAWKTALVQALTAGGEKDTDDTDTPIQGGVRKPRPAGPATAPTVTLEQVLGAIAEAEAGKSIERLKAAAAMAKGLGEADQAEVAGKLKAASAAIRGA
jgi:hypothetical protein